MSKVQEKIYSKSPVRLNAISVGILNSFLSFTIYYVDSLVYFRIKTVASRVSAVKFLNVLSQCREVICLVASYVIADKQYV
jgi:hypothetical protein